MADKTTGAATSPSRDIVATLAPHDPHTAPTEGAAIAPNEDEGRATERTGVIAQAHDVRRVQPSDEDATPIITVANKCLPEAVAAARDSVIAYNTPPTLFQHRGELVRLAVAHQGGPTIQPLNAADLQVELTYAARWFERSNRGVKPIYPPMLVVHDLLRRSAGWAPPLRDVIRVPVFGNDWRLLSDPGYHPADELFYHPDHAPLSSVSMVPEDEEIVEATRLLVEELLGQFPFASPSHRAAALAAMLVPFVRHRIDGATPLHLFDSPQPGTGKTLLADVVSIPALGREPAANTEIASADDLRKWVTSMAVAGEQVVLIDNVNARLRGSALAAALTKVEWCDRIVGTSRLARGRMRCLWLATGNNVATSGEIARRVVRCRLDAGIQRPYLRGGFTHPDLRSWAKANRHRLIWAALTLVHHWLAVGQPEGEQVLGSYESYCRIVGGILLSAGIEGFLADVRVEQAHCDDEGVEWSAFVAAWRERFGLKRVRTEDLDRELLSPNPEMLAAVLNGAASQRGRRIKLGQELRKRRDAVVGGCRVRVTERVDRHGCWQYWLEDGEVHHAEETAAPPSLDR